MENIEPTEKWLAHKQNSWVHQAITGMGGSVLGWFILESNNFRRKVDSVIGGPLISIQFRVENPDDTFDIL